MSPGSSTESYPAFAHIELRGKPRKNLNQLQSISDIQTRRDGGAQLLITKLCTNMPGLNPKSLRSAYEEKAYVTVDIDSSVGCGR
ncbi:hypothetical protein ANN_13273 [Periplaneta americana]|uniref:Uncharacterized protein n=1 Tax=Periplaneta americana TaxID=6978 RepID=A0ABQ8TIX4_PERAM|nr:hypothetical protein ANN_13273 [Periplaneta americana]